MLDKLTIIILQLLISYSEYHSINTKNHESLLAVDNVIAIITLLTFSGPPCGLYMKRMYRLLIRHIDVGEIFRSREQKLNDFRLGEHEIIP